MVANLKHEIAVVVSKFNNLSTLKKKIKNNIKHHRALPLQKGNSDIVS